MVLGLEMCFMGEVMGFVDSFGMVYVKVEFGVGEVLFIQGMVFFFIYDCDKQVLVFIVVWLIEFGFDVMVILGIVQVFVNVGLKV